MASENRENQPREDQVSSSSETSVSARRGSAPSTSRRVATRNTARKSYSFRAPKLQFEMKQMYVEDHKSPIYCVQFNYFVSNVSVFACVAKNRVSIYECELNGKLKFLQVYEDAEESEKYFTCAWSCLTYDDAPESVVAAAGSRGVIRILRPKTMTSVNTCPMAYSGEINELKFHPSKRELLLAASKDLTIRLWNVKTLVLIARFGGAEGHRDAVLSVDFNLTGERFLSCGMDHAIKCWKLDTEAIQDAIKRSYDFDIDHSSSSFKSYIEHYPEFSTRDIHTSYIDCIRWFNRLVIISKSNDNVLKFWLPVFSPDNKPGPYHEIRCEHCHVWFLKFSMDFSQKVLALGNVHGKIFVWNVFTPDPKMISCTILTHTQSNSTIRHTALSREGLILIGVGDDGSIWRWDRVFTPLRT